MDNIQAIQQINYAAENAHRRFLTFGYGHIMLYQEKADEAADYIAAKYPEDFSNFPLIKAEVDATDRLPRQVADDIILRKSDWVAASAKIEFIRLRAIRDISQKKKGLFELIQPVIQKLNEI